MKYPCAGTKPIPVKTYLALDRKIAMKFQAYAEKTPEYPHDYGEMRRLRIKLQNLCGITELEALNVLISRNVSDYIWKYNRCSLAEIRQMKNKTVKITGYIEMPEGREVI